LGQGEGQVPERHGKLYLRHTQGVAEKSDHLDSPPCGAPGRSYKDTWQNVPMLYAPCHVRLRSSETCEVICFPRNGRDLPDRFLIQGSCSPPFSFCAANLDGDFYPHFFSFVPNLCLESYLIIIWLSITKVRLKFTLPNICFGVYIYL